MLEIGVGFEAIFSLGFEGCGVALASALRFVFCGLGVRAIFCH